MATLCSSRGTAEAASHLATVCCPTPTSSAKRCWVILRARRPNRIFEAHSLKVSSTRLERTTTYARVNP